jgi:gluconokinase
MKQAPVSAHTKVGGIVYFARMLDKIRKQARGELPSDYLENLGKGFDGRCCNFLRVPYKELCARVLEGGNDNEILAWCQQRGRAVNSEDILVWNGFARTRGWRDEASEGFEEYKAASGLGHRKDLLTYFDYYEVDEGRAP